SRRRTRRGGRTLRDEERPGTASRLLHPLHGGHEHVVIAAPARGAVLASIACMLAGKLRIAASIDIVEDTGANRSPIRVPIYAAFALSAVLLLVSLVGILHPAIYGRETANWAAQAVGQDWVDLLVGAPWIATTGALSLRGSRAARILLAGGLFYAVYELVIY